MSEENNGSFRKSYNVYVSQRTFNKIEQLANENNLSKCEIIDKALYFLEEIYSNKVPQFRAMKEYLEINYDAFKQLQEEVHIVKEMQKSTNHLIVELISAIKDKNKA